MARKVPTWAGKTDDTPAPPRVRLRIFDAYGGVCQLTGRKIMPGDEWDLDHKTALINGGSNDEENLWPVLREAHREKTAADVAQKSKERRIRSKHIGLHKPKAILQGSRASPWKKLLSGQVVRRDGK